MRQKIIFLALLLLCCSTRAQNKKTDSLVALEKGFDSQKPDTNQLKILNELCRNYKNKGDYERAHQYAEKQISAAKKTGSLFFEASGLQNKGLIYYEQAQYENAIKYYLQALVIKEKRKDQTGIAMLLNNIGLVYMTQGKLNDALPWFFKAENIFNGLDKNSKGFVSGQGNNYNNIGLVNYYKMNFDTAMLFFMKALDLRITSGDEQKISESYVNVANVYYMQKKPDQAAVLYAKAMAIVEKRGDKRTMAILSLNLGELSFAMGKEAEGLEYANIALDVSKSIRALDVEKSCYELFQSHYFIKKDFKKAYQYYVLMSAAKDSVLNEKNQEQIEEMQTKYETEKKDKEILKKNNEIAEQKTKLLENEISEKQHKIVIYSVSLGFLLVFSLAFFIYRGYKQKEKANLIITSQKEEVEKQKAVIEEKQKEILDSIRYAHRIQKALITNEKYIEKHLNKTNKT